MKIPEEIKVKVTYTEGFEKRFTEACLEQLRQREENEKIEKAG
ncbi:hypothetical protein [Diplocloster hominis]